MANEPSRKAPQPPVEAPSRQAQHDTITRVAGQNRAEHSSFRNGVSVHRMPQSVTFASLRAVLSAATGQEQRTFVGTVDGKITVSVNFNYKPPSTPPPTAAVGKKRGRDLAEESISAAVARVKFGLTSADEVTDGMISEAKNALHSLITRLRGAKQENALESRALSYKKPETQAVGNAHTNEALRPRLILSARLTPGVAVPLPSLFQALGTRCTEDGMITTQESNSLLQGFNLPLSEQGQTAELHGQRALTLFATVGCS